MRQCEIKLRSFFYHPGKIETRDSTTKRPQEVQVLRLRALVQANVPAYEPRRGVPPEEEGRWFRGGGGGRPARVVLQEEVRPLPEVLLRLEVPQETRAGMADMVESDYLLNLTAFQLAHASSNFSMGKREIFILSKFVHADKQTLWTR